MPSRISSRSPAAQTYRRPRISLLHVFRRTFVRLIELQVWDVAGSITFYAALSVLPALVSVVSMVSLIGMADETVTAAAELANELVPTLDPAIVANTLLALGNTSGGLTGVVLGLVGSVISASNAVAAFHRAMHRIHDTREGRPLPWFRTIVVLETLVLMVGSIALLAGIVLGGDLSERLGRVLGLTQESVATWNLLKWPAILAVLVITVSLAYYLAPNVKLPRFRFMTAGGIISVLVLFGATLVLGWLVEAAGSFQVVLGTLNSAIGVLVLAWLAFIVLLAGAAFDAELLRARQLAAGLPAWDVLQLRTRHAGVLESLDAFAASARKTAKRVAYNAHDDEPVTVHRTARLVESGTLFAVDDHGRRVTTGQPYTRGEPDPE